MYYQRNREKCLLKSANYRKNNRLKVNKEQRDRNAKVKYTTLSHYSNGIPKCAHCGFEDTRALCIDHINNDGNQERKRLLGRNFGVRGTFICNYLYRNNFPVGYQVLCANCNLIKHIEKVKSDVRLRELELAKVL